MTAEPSVIVGAGRTARSIKDGPWCWQSKAARRLIRDSFDASHNVTTALATYDALTEIASDAQAEVFTTTHAWIQRISGVSVSTIQKHLRVFNELRLVSVSTARLRAPSTYTLLPFGNHCTTFGNGAQSHALPTSEEWIEDRNEEMKKGRPAVAGPVIHPSDASERRKPILGTRKNPRPLPKANLEVFTAAESLGISREIANAFLWYQSFNGWRMNGSQLVDWHKCLSQFARRDRERAATLKRSTIGNEEFWAFVDAEKIEHATANGWIRAMTTKKWRLPNPANGRQEPLRDWKAALRAFVGSDTNQVLESVGHYDE